LVGTLDEEVWRDRIEAGRNVHDYLTVSCGR
jgi:hypothetical protein